VNMNTSPAGNVTRQPMQFPSVVLARPALSEVRSHPSDCR
jgi:hypothetical protein